MSLMDFFFGSKPDMRLPGYAQGMIDQINTNINPRLGFSGRQYKKMAKQYEADPMSLATVSQAQGAVDRRNVDEDYMTGANRLLAQSGGEQANAQQHMRENAKEKVNERTGLNSINEANQKYFGALGGWQDAFNAKNQQEQQKYGLMSSLLGLGYDAKRRGGLFSPEMLMQGLGIGLRAGGVGGYGRP